MYSLINSLRQPRVLIPLKIIGVYAAWKLFHYWVGINGTCFHLLWMDIVWLAGKYYAAATAFVLSGLGLDIKTTGIAILFKSTGKELWVQEHCLALPAMVIFTGTIIFFEGRWRDKAWFIPLGLAGIACINIVRLAFVAMAWNYLTPYYFHMHHSLIYATLTYGFIFLLIRWWVLRIDGRTSGMV